MSFRHTSSILQQFPSIHFPLTANMFNFLQLAYLFLLKQILRSGIAFLHYRKYSDPSLHYSKITISNRQHMTNYFWISVIAVSSSKQPDVSGHWAVSLHAKWFLHPQCYHATAKWTQLCPSLYCLRESTKTTSADKLSGPLCRQRTGQSLISWSIKLNGWETLTRWSILDIR